jgi:hypothetical protein
VRAEKAVIPDNTINPVNPVIPAIQTKPTDAEKLTSNKRRSFQPPVIQPPPILTIEEAFVQTQQGLTRSVCI